MIKLIGFKEAEISKIIRNYTNSLSQLFKLKIPKLKVYFHKSRTEFDRYWGKKTPNWVVGFAKPGKNEVHLIHPKYIERLSIHKYNKREYHKLIFHELIHLAIFKRLRGLPYFINEAFTKYLSGLNNRAKLVKLFKKNAYIPNLKSIWALSSIGDETAICILSLFFEFICKKYGKRKVIIFLGILNNKTISKKFFLIYKKSFYGSISQDYKSFSASLRSE